MMIGPCDTRPSNIQQNVTYTFMWTTMAGYYSPSTRTIRTCVCVCLYCPSISLQERMITPFCLSTAIGVHAANWTLPRSKLTANHRRPAGNTVSGTTCPPRRIINNELIWALDIYMSPCGYMASWKGGGIDSQKLHAEGRRWAALRRSIHVDEKWWWCQSRDVIHHHCLVH